jgi:putative N6-adenine-specific DNA methylase
MSSDPLSIFLVVAPGLEAVLADEAREAGFKVTGTIAGGVSIDGSWPDVWRANLTLRGATRVLVRLAEFRAMHLAQLDKRARKLPWSDWLRPDVAVRVEATCRKSRIYHAGAAAQRIERAVHESLGAPVSPEADLVLKLRIEDDLATLSIDSSGPSLHKRGLKEQVNKAPMRETLAALFLRASGYDGTEPVVDPMCGSGTFVIEAAEIARGLLPGRARRFAFEDLASFDAEAWEKLRRSGAPRDTTLGFHGADRDAGAVRMSIANALRAGDPPDGPPGLSSTRPTAGGSGISET